ncbi:cytochrome oxidase assembly [Roridomyces roridus]|uniref:Cytochrome oxidase assembly n=1 Tax=Roridomyces roridus TaxID=1738132 RepID=A0AAD7C3X8_9AGAR|nr:cytochrome oxidase assembly [Roridomyces roridus]
MLLAVRRASCLPSLLKIQPLRPLAHPRVLLRFASVKSDVPRAALKAASVAKDAPPLVTKGAPAFGKGSNVVKPTSTATSPPQKQYPPRPTEKPSDASVPPSAVQPPPPPVVGIWLMVSSVLVLAVVVVGGVTRLTESGLSITQWRPITGILPPLSQEEWDEEFTKYKATPEFKMLNHSATLDDFKRIFSMEWSHRILGRLIGVVFVAPLAYFTMSKKISTPLAIKLWGLGLLIGAQGALGWYMVKSGLEDSIMETPGAVPRVSQYRLAAHLGLAFALYAGMFSTGMAIIKDRRFVNTGMSSGLSFSSFNAVMENPLMKRFKTYTRVLTGLVLLTAVSGAFVAGLDAGLVYNEWPLMGGRLVPPTDELFAPAYAKNEAKSDVWWNIFENPTTVQFDHRMLATTTYAGMAVLFAQTFRPAWRAILPPLVVTSTRAAFAMANVQVLLGISTLLYLVPVPLAASHQAGSILLLSTMLQLLVALRRPGAAARAWRNAMNKSPTS